MSLGKVSRKVTRFSLVSGYHLLLTAVILQLAVPQFSALAADSDDARSILPPASSTGVAPASAAAPLLPETDAFSQISKELGSGHIRTADPEWITHAFAQTKDAAIRTRFNSPSLSMPFSQLGNLKNQLRFNFDSDTRTFLITNIETGQSVGYDNVDILTTPIMDNDFIYFVSGMRDENNRVIPEGLRVISLRLLKKFGFLSAPRSFVVAPLALPEGSRVEKLDFLFRGALAAGYESLSERVVPNFMAGGDIGMKVTAPDGTVRHLWMDGDEIWANFAACLLQSVIVYLTRSPSAESVAILTQALRDNSADVERYKESVARRFETSTNNDLIDSTLATLALRGEDKGLAELLVRDRNGLTAVDRLRMRTRDRFPSDPQQWAEESARIRSLQPTAAPQTASFANAAMQTYLEEGSKPERGDLLRRTVGRTLELFERTVTHGGTAALIGTLLVGSYAYNQAVGPENTHALVTAIASRLQQASQSFAPLGVILSPVSNFSQFVGEHVLNSPDGWNTLGKWVGGVALYASLYPLMYLGNFAWAKMRGQEASMTWGGLRQVSGQNGVWGYGMLIRPFQEIFLRFLARQKNVYPAMLNYDADPYTLPGAFNSPFASEEAIAINRQNAETALLNDKQREIAASLLAGALVAAKATNVDPATLILADPNGRAIGLDALYTDPNARKEWVLLAPKLYAALNTLQQNTDMKIDGKIVETQARYYTALGLRIQHGAETNSPLAAKIKDRTIRFGRFLRDDVLSYVMFGLESLRSHYSLINAKISPETAKINGVGAEIDYMASVPYFGAEAPLDYSLNSYSMVRQADGTMQPEYHLLGQNRITGLQAEQIPIYGLQNPADIHLSAAAIPEESEYIPAAAQIFEPGNVARKQNLWEGLAAIAGRSFEPGAPSYFQNHAQFIRNLASGLQARLLMGGIPLAIAYHTSGMEKSAFFSTLFILCNKLGFQVVGGVVTAGYAIVWPYIAQAMKHMGFVAERNRKRIQAAAVEIEQGYQMRDLPRMHKGIAMGKELYAEGLKELPASLNIPTSRYDFELGHRFFSHMAQAENLPLPTVGSDAVGYALNLFFGVVMSVVLYNEVSKGTLFSKTMNSFDAFVIAAGWLAATYVALTQASKITGHLVPSPQVQTIVGAIGKTVRGVQSWCAKNLLMQTPIVKD